MALSALESYNNFKSDVGGSLELTMLGHKRAIISQYSLLSAELKTAWDATVGSLRLDGEAAYNFFKTSVEAEEFSPSLVTVRGTRARFPLWINISAKLQAAWEAVADGTA